MKKIKFLHGFVITLTLLFTIGFLTTIHIHNSFEGQQYIDAKITSFFSLLLILGLFFIQRALFSIIKKGYFNSIASKRFKIAGMFFVITGFGSAIFSVIVLTREIGTNSQFLLHNFILDFLLVMIGFGLFIFADVIKKGNILEQENQLTI